MQRPVVPVYRRRARFDPDPELALLRDVSPVVRIEMPGYTTEPAWAWLVTRHEDVRCSSTPCDVSLDASIGLLRRRKRSDRARGTMWQGGQHRATSFPVRVF